MSVTKSCNRDHGTGRHFSARKRPSPSVTSPPSQCRPRAGKAMPEFNRHVTLPDSETSLLCIVMQPSQSLFPDSDSDSDSGSPTDSESESGLSSSAQWAGPGRRRARPAPGPSVRVTGGGPLAAPKLNRSGRRGGLQVQVSCAFHESGAGPGVAESFCWSRSNHGNLNCSRVTAGAANKCQTPTLRVSACRPGCE
jgi:hypothetical protein